MMKEKPTTPEAHSASSSKAMVFADNRSIMKKANRKVLLLIAGALLIIALGIGLLVWYRHHQDSKNNQNAVFTSMINQSTMFINKQQYSAAEQLVQDYLSKYPSTTHRRDAYFQLTNAYAAAGDSKQLLIWYQKIAALDKTPQLDVVTGLAYAYQAQHDNTNAINYFKQAITLSEKSTDPMKDSNIATYKYLIQQMGGSL